VLLGDARRRGDFPGSIMSHLPEPLIEVIRRSLQGMVVPYVKTVFEEI
jgi:hypothetical protein